MKRGKMVHSGKSVEEALAPIIFGLEELVRGKPKEEKHGEPCKICGWDCPTPILEARDCIEKALDKHPAAVVSWSGERCSTAVLYLTREIKPDIKVIFNDTGVEFSETYDFIKKISKAWDINLEILKPKRTFWDIVGEYGFPMMRGQYKDDSKSKNHNLEKYVGESTDEVMQNVEDYAQEIKETTCRWCGADLSKESIMGYPHSRGWTVYGKKEKYWLYIICPNCQYQWALWKLGVSRE